MVGIVYVVILGDVLGWRCGVFVFFFILVINIRRSCIVCWGFGLVLWFVVIFCF